MIAKKTEKEVGIKKVFNPNSQWVTHTHTTYTESTDSLVFLFLLLIFFFVFLGPHLEHIEIPRLGVELEL